MIEQFEHREESAAEIAGAVTSDVVVCESVEGHETLDSGIELFSRNKKLEESTKK